jgi:hypothetical protein
MKLDRDESARQVQEKLSEFLQSCRASAPESAAVASGIRSVAAAAGTPRDHHRISFTSVNPSVDAR